MSEKHEGGCFCGSVRYSTMGQPFRAAVCHCRYCQLRTGTAFGISVYFKEDKVVINDGACDTFSYETESGSKATLSRCANCGTTISWRISLDALNDLVGIAGGTFDPQPSGMSLTVKYSQDLKPISARLSRQSPLKKAQYINL